MLGARARALEPVAGDGGGGALRRAEDVLGGDLVGRTRQDVAALPRTPRRPACMRGAPAPLQVLQRDVLALRDLAEGDLALVVPKRGDM